MMRMRIVVHTVLALGPTEQVYLTGDSDELGRWNPAGLAMTRTDDTRWEVVVPVPPGTPFECKLTRGTWATEAADAKGFPLSNLKIIPPEEGQVDIHVVQWADEAAPGPTSGIVGEHEKWPAVQSRFLERDRDVLLWFPPGYHAHPGKRYPVLYMHDARQVFDPSTSTWGKDWQVDDLAQEMILTGELEPFLVVAADCTDNRFAEYSPAHQGDAYLRFLLEELKPMVDEQFRTLPERTYIAGSSMGGLISFYAAWKRPDVYAGAACLSPAFGERFDAQVFRMVEEDRENLPSIRLFLSCGGEGHLERQLLAGTLKMADL
ncbi:MAG: hypothetical protein LBN38_05605, partial [Verrucomicrobiota bacterium]|nr:hypothetical protein [Verrucomicrobiota bacterium]